MKKLKFLPLLLVLVLSLGIALAGCSDGDKMRIELLTWHNAETGDFYEGYVALAEAYEAENPDVDIVIRSEPESSYNSILETGFSGGTISDIIQMKQTERTLYNSYVLNLEPYLNEQSPYATDYTTWKDSFEDGWQRETVAGGSTGYAYIPHDTNPYIASGRFWVFNKSMVDDAFAWYNEANDSMNAELYPDLSVEKTPTTWKEMFQWLEAITLYAESDAAPSSLTAALAGDKDVAAKVTPIMNEMGVITADAFFNGRGEGVNLSSLGDKIMDDDTANSLFNYTRVIVTAIPNPDSKTLDPSYDPELIAKGSKEANTELGYGSSVGQPVGLIGYLPYYDAMFQLGAQSADYYQEGWIEADTSAQQLAFARGQTAMITAFSWSYSAIEETMAGSQYFEDGVLAFPTPCFGADTLDYCVAQGWINQEEADKAAPYVTTTLSNSVSGRHEYGFSVSSTLANNTEKLEKVIDFLQFATSKAQQQNYVNISGSSSPVKGVDQPESSEIFQLPPDSVFETNKYNGPVVLEWSNDWGPVMYNYITNASDSKFSSADRKDWKYLITDLATDLHRDRFVANETTCKEQMAAIKAEYPEDYETNADYIRYEMLLEYYWNGDAVDRLIANYQYYLENMVSAD